MTPDERPPRTLSARCLVVPLVLWAPLPPDNANGRGHWSAFHRARKAYVTQLGVRRMAGHIPRPPAECPARARIDVLRLLSGRDRVCDTDNLVRRCKPLVDWLVRGGYLAGDDPAHLAWGAVEQTTDAPDDDRPRPPLASVRITLTPITED